MQCIPVVVVCMCVCMLGGHFAAFCATPSLSDKIDNNLRGTIFANHQISHLAVIFAVVKFVNHCMHIVLRFVWPDQFLRPSLITG